MDVNSEEGCSLLQGVIQEGDQKEDVFVQMINGQKSKEKLGWVPREKGFHFYRSNLRDCRSAGLSHPESPVSSQQESVLSCQQLWRSPTDGGIAFWWAIKCDVAGCRCQEIHCECMRDAVRLKEGSGSCKYLLDTTMKVISWCFSGLCQFWMTWDSFYNPRFFFFILLKHAMIF